MVKSCFLLPIRLILIGCGEQESPPLVVDGNLSIAFSVANAGPYELVGVGVLEDRIIAEANVLDSVVDIVCASDGAAPASPSAAGGDKFFESKRGILWDAGRLVVLTSTRSLEAVDGTTGLFKPIRGDRVAVSETLALDVCGRSCRSGSFELEALSFDSFPGCE